MFVDPGVPELLKQCFAGGVDKAQALVFAAGGATARASPGASFVDIGGRNLTALRKVLWKAGLSLAGSHVGGMDTRQLSLDCARREVVVKTRHEEIKLW